MIVMSVEPLTPEDFDFLAYYGKTMASVQEFEFAIIRLARLILPQLSEDVIWRRSLAHEESACDRPLEPYVLDTISV
jgi:hypothetical protein